MKILGSLLCPKMTPWVVRLFEDNGDSSRRQTARSSKLLSREMFRNLEQFIK